MDIAYITTFFITFAACILSGMAGGGGSFITAPYWLIIGMTPAQGATTGGFMAIGMSTSSLFAFGKTNNYPRNKKLTIALISITTISSIVGSFVLTRIDVSSFKNILAIITILSIPLLFIDSKKINLSNSYQKIGVIFFVILLFASSVITSSAFSVLITVGLIQLFNLSIIESTAMRRLIGLLQSIIIFGILAWQGNFLIFHGIAAIIGGSLGSYLGTRFAIKKGEGFAKYALAIGAFVGAVALIW